MTTECAVCYEIIAEPMMLACKHVFCISCMIKCDNCPFCRKEIDAKFEVDREYKMKLKIKLGKDEFKDNQK